MHANMHSMRTTVEIPDEYCAKLLELAVRRGEKGFSGLVQEAVAKYLAEAERREDTVREAQQVIGKLTEAEARALEEGVRTLRDPWR